MNSIDLNRNILSFLRRIIDRIYYYQNPMDFKKSRDIIKTSGNELKVIFN